MNENEKPERSRESTRRDFIKTTAVTAAGAVVASYWLNDGASAQEEGGKAPSGPNERVNLGLIGTGGMGSAHLISFMEMAEGGLENVQITAVSDVAIPRLESNADVVSKRQGTPVARYPDYRALLDSKDVDCVVIASPEHWHAQMAIDALAAGKDVYLEKPMTLRLDEAFKLRRAVSDNKKHFVQVGTQFMMYPKYKAAKKLIAAGEIGHPTFSQTSYCRNSLDGEWLYGIDPAIVPGPALDWDAWCGPLGKADWDPEIYFRWRRYRNYSTGIIGDLLVHKMTPLMMAIDAGWPVRVTAHGGHYVDKAMENHDQVNITVQFEKEHTMIVAGSTCNEQGLQDMIRGHRGTIYLGGSDMVLRPERIFVDDLDEQQEKYEGMEPQNELRRNFLDCVR
ncbi:MAG: Gfo/Idh/MocA family oxidoreductase, partial [Planctomycetota bacterium]